MCLKFLYLIEQPYRTWCEASSKPTFFNFRHMICGNNIRPQTIQMYKRFIFQLIVMGRGYPKFGYIRVWEVLLSNNWSNKVFFLNFRPVFQSEEVTKLWKIIKNDRKLRKHEGKSMFYLRATYFSVGFRVPKNPIIRIPPPDH